MVASKSTAANKVGAPNYLGEVNVARAYYDFAVDGGAVGAITLRGDKVPSGALVTDTLIHVNTVVTGGAGATASLGVEAATDVRAAATLATAPALDSTGAKRSAVLTATTAPVTTTAERSVVATVAVNALTAGKFSVLVYYVELYS